MAVGGGTYVYCIKVPGKITGATVKGVDERHRVKGGIDSGASEQETDTGIEEIYDAPNVSPEWVVRQPCSENKKYQEEGGRTNLSPVLI